MSELRSRQASAPPLSPSAQLSIALGAIILIGGLWYFKGSMKMPPEVQHFTKAVMKSFH